MEESSWQKDMREHVEMEAALKSRGAKITVKLLCTVMLSAQQFLRNGDMSVNRFMALTPAEMAEVFDQPR